MPRHAGVEALHEMLSHQLPDSFFPSSMPFVTQDGYTIQVMCSIQVGTE